MGVPPPPPPVFCLSQVTSSNWKQMELPSICVLIFLFHFLVGVKGDLLNSRDVLFSL